MHAMWIVVYAVAFLLTFSLGILLMPAARRIAERTGLLDLPDARKPQRRPVPLCGGIAMFGAVAGVLLLGAALLLLASRTPAIAALMPASLRRYLPGALSVLPKLVGIALGGLTIFLLGLWDDARELAPRVKLMGQLFVALALVALDVRVTVFVPNYLFSVAITTAWIVVITNAFNLLDNMDGLCAGVAAIASLIFFCLSALQGHYFIALLLAVLTGGVLAFLRYNFPPAEIFMGDAGSMFIGYFVAVVSIMQTYYEPSSAGPLAVLMPLVILAVPMYDTLSVVVIRIRRGESIFKADRRHFSHRLLALGMSERGAVCFIYLVTLCTGLSATFLPRVGWAGGIIVFAQAVLVVMVIAILEYFGGRKGAHG